jgi:hypothetical protein
MSGHIAKGSWPGAGTRGALDAFRQHKSGHTQARGLAWTRGRTSIGGLHSKCETVQRTQ